MWPRPPTIPLSIPRPQSLSVPKGSVGLDEDLALPVPVCRIPWWQARTGSHELGDLVLQCGQLGEVGDQHLVQQLAVLLNDGAVVRVLGPLLQRLHQVQQQAHPGVLHCAGHLRVMDRPAAEGHI